MYLSIPVYIPVNTYRYLYISLLGTIHYIFENIVFHNNHLNSLYSVRLMDYTTSMCYPLKHIFHKIYYKIVQIDQ